MQDRLGGNNLPGITAVFRAFHAMGDTSKDDQSARKGDPGAVRLGNFVNYYQFHPPDDRIKHLPVNILPKRHGGKIVCLDVGCNTGDLTQELFHYVSRNVEESHDKTTNENNCYILGVDIDPALIFRAEASNRYKNHVSYHVLDIMNDDSNSELQEYLTTHNVNHFSAIFCFSVTMWIHLNHGDEGLKMFLSNLCKMAEFLVIEPQPWKCYQTAVRRLKKNNQTFPNIHELRMNKNVDSNIEDIIQNKHKFQKIYESCPNSWGRKIVFFKKTGGVPE